MMTLHSIASGASARTLVRNLVGVAVAGIALVSASASDYTDTKAYVVPVSTDYVVLPLLSVGDQVPNTRNPTLRYQMVGIPDGLGAYKASGHRTILHMNHELGNTVLSEPNVGGTRHRGAFVSRWVLDRHARVISGEVAYDEVFDEELHQQLPPPQENNSTPGFAQARFHGRRPDSIVRSILPPKRATARRHLMEKAVWRSRSSIANFIRCRNWAASPGKIPWFALCLETARR